MPQWFSLHVVTKTKSLLGKIGATVIPITFSYHNQELLGKVGDIWTTFKYTEEDTFIMNSLVHVHNANRI